MRVVADHARATAFLIADGIVPSNEGRGYVLRRIMRRALRHGKKLGFDGPFLHRVAGTVVEEFREAYPGLAQSASFIDTVAFQEERRFLETLDAGLRMVEEEFSRMSGGGKVFPGEVAFRLYDTYGFPADLTADLCRERGVALDSAGFEKEMEKQRAQSRVSWKGGEIGPRRGGLPPGSARRLRGVGRGSGAGDRRDALLRGVRRPGGGHRRRTG
jgi:alanyl-tRNA synthetase